MGVSELPAHWVRATISEVVDPVESVDPSAAPEAWIDYIDIGSIDNHAGVVAAPKRMMGSDAPSRARQAVRPDDALFSTVRPYLRAIAAVPSLQRPVASTGFCVLRPAPGIDPRYLLHWVRSTEFVDRVVAFQRGSSYPAVRDADVQLQPLPLPPSAEQRRIAARLDELLTQLDAAKAELTEAKRKLSLYRQSLLKSAVEGTLTAEWRGQHPPPQEAGIELLARILRERASVVNRNALGPDLTGAPTLPADWAWASLDQLLCSLRSGTAETSGREVTPFPVLKSSAVRHNSIDYALLNYLDSTQSRAENFLATGDLLITRLSGSVAYVGCAAMVESEQSPRVQYPDRAFCGRPASSAAALIPFVALCFEASLIRKRVESAAKSTAGHKRISMSDLRPLPIPIPPMAEVSRIVEVCRAAFESTQELALAIEHLLALATAQRQNILRAAFSGQLVPQDPNDEPASVLLERIRAKRLAATPVAKRKPGRSAKATA